ncbi:MAG TPA: PPC domain-containing protein [Polyangiaceae bacterium]|nr:PPC domain-containing protein [Polyangiaceae bacterium]
MVVAVCGCTFETTDGSHDGGNGTGTGGVPDGTGGAGGSAPATGGASSAGGAAASAGGSDAHPADASTPDGGATPLADDCNATEAHPNETRETATPFTLGRTVHACLQSYGDNDFYQFTSPASPVQGGVVAVDITDVGAQGSVEVAVQTATDNGTLTGPVGYHGDAGQNVSFWLAAAPSATFRINVHYYLSSPTETPYTLRMRYIGVPDDHEPNDTRSTATSIQAGQAVTGYFFSGFETASESVPWDDWYKVSLPAGTAHIALTDLAEDLQGNIELQDSNGQHVTKGASVSNGASVTVTATVTAGDYYVQVTPAVTYNIMGSGQKVPTFATTPYTLTATAQ